MSSSCAPVGGWAWGRGVEFFSAARERGSMCLLDQIDAGRSHYDLMRKQSEQWEGWSLEKFVYPPDEYFQRSQREWELADFILVQSSWVRDCLVSQGVSLDKMVCVPPVYETESDRPVGPRGRNGSGPLRVLYVGNLSIMKGIQYLVKATRCFSKQLLQVKAVGPVRLSAQALSQLPDNITVTGPVARDQIQVFLDRADVLVLPTISDSFPVTQLEAMACGLPVVISDQAGSIVEHGRTGLIVKTGSVQDLVEALDCLASDRELCANLGRNATEAVKEFNLTNFGRSLRTIVERKVQ